ncbi:hypothetical protein CGMCC3_g14663 [Colletotrichum fructicola]|nr:uncharacterized protein CGMCC3_g14663 [Colletotrichum fructicola]KAE9569112.1 hypothetical protein CGMCC3_g14663 [Colletotrichum fructicola]
MRRLAIDHASGAEIRDQFVAMNTSMTGKGANHSRERDRKANILSLGFVISVSRARFKIAAMSSWSVE